MAMLSKYEVLKVDHGPSQCTSYSINYIGMFDSRTLKLLANQMLHVLLLSQIIRNSEQVLHTVAITKHQCWSLILTAALSVLNTCVVHVDQLTYMPKFMKFFRDHI